MGHNDQINNSNPSVEKIDDDDVSEDSVSYKEKEPFHTNSISQGLLRNKSDVNMRSVGSRMNLVLPEAMKITENNNQEDSTEDNLDKLLGHIGMGRWQLLVMFINLLIWSILSPHTIGTTLLNAPVPFSCSNNIETKVTCISQLNTEDGILPTVDGIIPTEDRILPSENSIIFNSTSEITDTSGSDENSPESDEIDVLTIYDNENSIKLYTKDPSTYSDIILSNETYTNCINKTTIYDNVCIEPSIHHGEGISTSTGLQSCPYISYDHSIFSSTITTQWNLICERSIRRTLFQNAYSVGVIFGCFIGGDIGDRLGRRWAIFMGSIFHVLGSVTVAITPWFPLLLFSRFIVGITNLVILVPAVTLALETCPSNWRGPVGIIVGLPYSIGVVVFAGVGYFIRNWRLLYIASSLPAVLLIPAAWFLDESPRWLIQVGRKEEAVQILHKAAKRNRVSSTLGVKEIKDTVENMVQHKSKDPNEFDVSLKIRIIRELKELKSFLGTPIMRRITVIAPLAKCLSEIVYYGIIFNANNFSSSDPFTYVAMSGVADAAAIAGGMLAVKYLPLRVTVSGGHLFSGALTLLVLAVSDKLRWLQWILVMTGFFLVAVASQTCYVYLPELFPTTLRTRGFAFTSFMGNVGTFIAPFVSDVFVNFGWWVTGTILGTCGVLAGLLIFFLPETKGQPMCETVEDVKNRGFTLLGRTHKPIPEDDDEPITMKKITTQV